MFAIIRFKKTAKSNYKSHYDDWDTRHNEITHSRAKTFMPGKRTNQHIKPAKVSDWRAKCIRHMDTDEKIGAGDHEEAQPQDDEKARKEDTAQRFEDIYNQIAAERKAKKAAEKEERRKEREAEAAKTETKQCCEIF